LNPRAIRRIANVLVLSLLRAGRSGGRTTVASLINSARAIAVLDAVIFAAVSIGAYQILIRIPAPPQALTTALVQALTGVPIYVISATVMIGIMLEVSQPTQFASSDIVNWLPVTASDFVLGCALSTVYTYSFILAAVAGISLGTAIWVGQIWGAIAFTLINAIAMFLGAFAVEIVRAVMNRASSTFYRRGGRSSIVVRLVVIILFVAVFQLMFQPQLYFSFFQTQAEGIKSLWFLPIVWPSLAVTSSLEAQLTLSLTYGVLTAAFTGALLYVAVLLRGKYWVPTQVSIKLASGPYAPRIGLLGKIGLTSAESAIVRKDLRAMTRRTEMIRMLALPVAMIIPMILSIRDPSAVQRGTLLFTVSIGFAFLALFVSMISVGQEGRAVWHIHASTLDPGHLIRAKATVTLLISLIPAIALSSAVAWFMNMSLQSALQLCAASALLVLTETFIGLAVGARHPDFQEIPRSRFLTPSGYMIGTLVGLATMGVVLAPVLYAFFVAPSSSIAAFALPLVVAETLVMSLLGYYLAKSGAKSLLTELPV